MKESELNRLGFELVGYVAVDSGIVVLVDPCYVIERRGEEPKVFYEDQFEAWDKTEWKAAAVQPWGEDFGLCIGTLYGDGTYPVYGRKVKDMFGSPNYAQVLIDFDQEDDDDRY